MKKVKMTVIPAGEDPELTMKILRRFIPGIDIKTIEITPGKHIETSGLARYIRLDIHAVLQDGKNVLIEMQLSAEADFVHRIRYCRSQNDVRNDRKGGTVICRMSSSCPSACSTRSGAAGRDMILNTVTGKIRLSVRTTVQGSFI